MFPAMGAEWTSNSFMVDTCYAITFEVIYLATDVGPSNHVAAVRKDVY